jgi:predicted nucleic acid-binding protein
MKPLLRIAIDTNVFVSALLSYDSTPGLAVQLALDLYQVILSGPTHNELEDVLRRQKIARLMSGDRR